MQEKNFDNFLDISSRLRLQIMKMITSSRSSHIGSCFSIIEILTILYFDVMKLNTEDSLDDTRDRFILSKGHAAAALYAVLAERGFFKKDVLDNYYQNGSSLPGHVSYKCLPGVELSTGSLGHGLPIGIGMAMAAKMDKKRHKTFVLLGDGECNEGSNWEAILFAGHHKLDNLVVIVDYNKWQACGKTNDVLNLEPFAKKWEDFGWAAKEIDGHNLEEIYLAFRNLPLQEGKPSVVIAHTIKGKELPFMENTLKCHYCTPTEEEFKAFIKNNSQNT